ncbi:TPA: hypothetical protein ACMSHF_002261, partial [Neisseria gonorrhoeae]
MLAQTEVIAEATEERLSTKPSIVTALIPIHFSPIPEPPDKLSGYAWLQIIILVGIVNIPAMAINIAGILFNNCFA